jgi:hypothetical protein
LVCDGWIEKRGQRGECPFLRLFSRTISPILPLYITHLPPRKPTHQFSHRFSLHETNQREEEGVVLKVWSQKYHVDCACCASKINPRMKATSKLSMSVPALASTNPPTNSPCLYNPPRKPTHLINALIASHPTSQTKTTTGMNHVLRILESEISCDCALPKQNKCANTQSNPITIIQCPPRCSSQNSERSGMMVWRFLRWSPGKSERSW